MQKLEERQKNLMGKLLYLYNILIFYLLKKFLKKNNTIFIFCLGSEINMIKVREERKLTLRKDKFLKDIMFKSCQNHKQNTRKFNPIIDISTIDLPPEIIENFELAVIFVMIIY